MSRFTYQEIGTCDAVKVVYNRYDDTRKCADAFNEKHSKNIKGTEMVQKIWQTVSEALGLPKNETDEDKHDPIHIVTGALMVHVAITHDDFNEAERQNILICLKDHFDLEEEHALEVFERAMDHHDDAVDLYSFTRVIMKELDQERQQQIVKLLYRVAFADDHLDHFEEHIISRIAGLLGVGVKDRVRLKHEVRDEKL